MIRDPIGYRVRTINNLMKRQMDKCFGHHPDKGTMMHTWIIDYLLDQENAGIETFQKDIEKEFSINRSTTSEMLNLMCKKGMIEKVSVSYDARLKKIVLTKQSRDWHLAFVEQLDVLHQNMKKGLSDKELDDFIRVCDKIIDNVQDNLEKEGKEG